MYRFKVPRHLGTLAELRRSHSALHSLNSVYHNPFRNFLCSETLETRFKVIR